MAKPIILRLKTMMGFGKGRKERTLPLPILRGFAQSSFCMVMIISRLQRLDLDDGRRVVVADPQLRGTGRLVDIDTADIGLGRQEIIDHLSGPGIEPRNMIVAHTAGPGIGAVVENRII